MKNSSPKYQQTYFNNVQDFPGSAVDRNPPLVHGTQVRSLVQFHISHSNYTSTPQLLMPACFGVHKPQLLSLSAASTETRASRVCVLQKERPRNEKPTYHNKEQLPRVMSKIFTAKSGIRQECPLSLLLLNIILDFLDTVQGKEKTSKLERKHCHYLQMTRYYIPKALKF